MQSEFWEHIQSTVLPMIVYRLADDGKVWAESHIFISDDTNHDNDFARHCVKKVVQRLKDEGVDVKKISFWSDGCAAQVKAFTLLAAIASYCKSLLTMPPPAPLAPSLVQARQTDVLRIAKQARARERGN